MRVVLIASSIGIDVNAHTAAQIFEQLGGNTGNVAFVNAIRSHLGGSVTVLPWHATAEQIGENGDVVVLACANQLGPHTDMGRQADILEAAKLPVIALGLGAQANSQDDGMKLTDGTRRWVEAIAAHAPGSAPNIGVRGAYTLAELDKIGLADKAVIIGCPSNFTNLDTDYAAEVERRLHEPINRVSSAIGLPYWPQIVELERQVLDMVEQTGGEAVVQHGLGMIQLAKGEFDTMDPKTLEASRAYFRPNLTVAQFKDWCRRYLRVYGSVEAWTTASRATDFVLGPRFHGVMLPFQAGIPVGCIAHDSRTLELCQTMGIPVLWHREIIRNFKIDDVVDLFTFNASDYRAKRQRLLSTYRTILSNLGATTDLR